jgi:predicted TIM-barrel fold metal-dependent hydrolase
VDVDIGDLAWAGGPTSRTRLHEFLKDAAGHDLLARIMFGSDALAWPQAIGESIKAVDAAPLNARQKRAIFFENAKRFFRVLDAPG